MSLSLEAPAVGPAMRAEVLDRLAEIERGEGVRVLLAIESGSRAWGFHSEDSDYDVRFIYARPVDWHLTVRRGRDVIERPISDALDLSGWELAKALGLMLGSNAVALEWLQSPIRYREVPGFAEELLAFGGATLRPRPVMWHYLRLAERQSERLAAEDGTVRLKPYFYTLRPALALRWLRLRPGAGTPPMDMASLIAGADLGAALVARIQELTERKRRARECGTVGASDPEVDALISAEVAHARAALNTGRPETHPADAAEADRLHRRWTWAADPRAGEAWR